MMSDMFTPAEAALWLKDRDNFLILTHRRPDGDTLGCAGALAVGLREFGKTAYVLENVEATPRYAPFVDDCWAPDGYSFDHIIAVDTASTDLFTENARKYKDSVSLCIDHHGSNTGYAKNLCLVPDVAACGEVVYEILMILTGKVSSDSAERLYVAISTDTGCFSFGNVTPNTFAVTAKLADTGVPIATLNKRLFRSRSPGRVLLEGLLTSDIGFFFGGKVAIACITRDMIETSNATEDDMDNIAEVAAGIEGVCMGITIRELSSLNDCKISVRSVEPYDSNAVCRRFGGGGHRSAAGCTFKKTIDEIKSLLLDVLKEIFD